jgi:WD40 repeat protein
MSTVKLKVFLVLLLTAGLTLGGAGLLAHQILGAKNPAEPPPSFGERAVAPSPESKAKAAVDRFGDPLPERAVARLGTIRFRMSGLVYACAWSPDGKTLAASSTEKTVTLFDAATGRPLRHLQGNPFSATSLAYAPDGRTLAAGYENGSIVIWNCATAKMVRQFRASERGPIWRVWSLAFTPDGKGLISAGEDKVIRLWEPATGKEVRRFTGHEKDVRCAVLSSDGRTLASAADKEIRLWETATGKMIRCLTEHKEAIRALALSADGKLLASGSKDGMIYLWETATGAIRRRFPEEVKQPRDAATSHAHALAFSPDGKILVVGGADHTLSLWDVATGKKLHEIAGVGSNTYAARYHDGGIQCVVFSRDGKKIVLGRDNTLDWFDVSLGKEVSPLPIHRGAVRRMFFRPDGHCLITVGDDPERRVLEWDANTGRPIRRIPGKAINAHLVCFSPDGKLMASTLFDTALHLWDTTSGKEIRKIPLPLKDGSSSPNEVIFSPNGKQLAVVGPLGKAACLLEASTGKQLLGMGPEKDWTFVHAFFSSDSRLLALVGNEAIQFLDISSDQHWPMISLPKDRISFAAALSPDGRTLALASAEWAQETNAKKGSYPPGYAPRVLKVRDITLWETAAGKKRGTFPSPGDRVHALTFSPDSRLLTIAGEDRAVHLWDIVKGEWLRHLQGHLGEVGTLAFSRDGRRLASGSQDTTALIWDVSGLAKKLPPHKPLTRKELDELWSILAGADAVKAYRAILTLEAAPDQAVSLLAERLWPEPADDKRIARLLALLDSDDFTQRERATKELQELGWTAEAALHKALDDKPSLEMRQRVKTLLDGLRKRPLLPELLRMLRGLEVLEHIGTPAAREVIASLAEGAAQARLTREAKAALQRLR